MPGDKPLAAVPAQYQVLEIFRDGWIAVHDLLKYRIKRLLSLRLRQACCKPHLSQEFIFLVAQQFTPSAVDHGDPAVSVEADHEGLYRIQVLLVAVTLLTQRGFSLPSLGIVAEYQDYTYYYSLDRSDRRGAVMDRDLPAIAGE